MKGNKKIWIILLALIAVAAIVFAIVKLTAPKQAEVLEITAFRGDPGDQPTDDNKIYKKIEEKFGIKFKWEFLAGDLDEKLGMMNASGDYPDIIDGSNSADKLIENGALINLMDYISAEKTPNIWKHIEPQKARLIEKVDGKDTLYIIPNFGLADGEQIALSVGGPAFFLQKQVLVDAGYPAVKDITIDQYFELIENFLAKHPTNDDGTPYTGFAILTEDWRRFCLINPVQHLMGRPNDGEVLVDVNDPDFHTETFIDKPYAKAYYKKLNTMFHKGMISKDTFVMNYDQYIAALSSGTVLGMFDQAWDFGNATQALIDAKMFANTYVALGPVYSAEDVAGIEMPTPTWKIEEHYLNGSLPNVRRGYGISVKCKDPERIVKMFEELLSDEWAMLLNWGIEGEDYSITDEGRLNMTEEQYYNTQDANWKKANKADALWQGIPKKQGWILNDIKVGDKTVKAGNCWEPGSQDEIVFGLMNDYDKDFLSHYNYKKFADFVNPPIELAPYGEAWQINYEPVDVAHQDFVDIQDKMLPTVITCDEEAFDETWDKFVEAIKPFAKEFGDYMQEQVVKEAHKVLDNK
ncbi:MAG: extracellular solute-binding protein [Clostridia bacterium]|nr:extracellular solute-binding protein [Clostridia bacterium]